MSGPVSTEDVPAEPGATAPEACEVEISDSREATVGRFRVRRALPRRARRTVGAWCFVDHMGPAPVTEERGLDVGPHPHIGLQTVTWLLEGEALHRDSLGSEQVIRPGQLNLMTAGHGVSHSEEATGSYRGTLQGVQLWVAQPEATRHGAPAFEHHENLPRFEEGTCTATVLVGELAGLTSPARRDTEHVGADLALQPGQVVLPLHEAYEYALVVLTGTISIGGARLEPGHLGYLGTGRQEVSLQTAAPARALLLGGEPFPDPILMWWNYVARTRAEIVDAHRAWSSSDPRFGRFASPLDRIDVPAPPWRES
jgi:redox-sensitive bicupin YhaK (pirin superfamily)